MDGARMNMFAHDVVWSAVRQNYGGLEQEVDMLLRTEGDAYVLVGRLTRKRSTEWGPWRFAAAPKIGFGRIEDGLRWANLAEAKRGLTPRRKCK